jgi:hypothetical protein
MITIGEFRNSEKREAVVTHNKNYCEYLPRGKR